MSDDLHFHASTRVVVAGLVPPGFVILGALDFRAMAAAPVMRTMLIAACALLCACSGEVSVVEAPGDAENGRLLLRQSGCGSCHAIPGVATAQGNVGPPLDAIARRVYLAGSLPNTPGNMVRWIRAPKSIDPQTTMPDLQVTEAHARDMTAYLYRLR